MVKVMYSKDGQVGQDVEMVANYGDGGVLIEFSNGTRELVGRQTIDFDYFAAEKKKPATGGTYNGPIPEVGAIEKTIGENFSFRGKMIPPIGSVNIPPVVPFNMKPLVDVIPMLKPRPIPFPLAEVNLGEPVGIMNIGETVITKEMAEDFMETIPTHPGMVMKEAYLEEWPDATTCDCGNCTQYDVDSVDIAEDIDAMKRNMEQMAAELRAVRDRSARKGKKNIRLSDHNDLLARTLAEQNKDMDALIKDNKEIRAALNEAEDKLTNAGSDLVAMLKKVKAAEDVAAEWKKTNDYHRNEVEKGNEFREGLKQTITALHEQLEHKNQAIEGRDKLVKALEAELERADRVIDWITKRSHFENV